MSLAHLTAFGAFLGATGTVAGAFGSHYLRNRLTEDRQRSWATAVQYQLLHAALIFSTGMAIKSHPALQHNANLKRAMMLWCGGTAVFSGSIYLLCLGYKGVLGPITPLGGLVLIAGWGCAILAAL
jgi:uncharacterized membrane protein YgdD (TMEM256/DUF423 family)